MLSLLLCAAVLSSPLVMESESIPGGQSPLVAVDSSAKGPMDMQMNMGTKLATQVSGASPAIFSKTSEGAGVSAGASSMKGGGPPPIDFVYTWYNSKDEATRRIREEIQNKFVSRGDSSIADDANFIGRYKDNEELKYSLRSVAMHAPWVRNIFIVVGDGQPLPKWLNTAHEKIKVVRHSQFFPAEDSRLPTFNSLSIEACLHRIRGLAEHFVYFNDDFFLGAEVQPSTFINKWGQPRIWIDKGRSNSGPVSGSDDGHTAAEKNTNNLVEELVRNHQKDSSIVGKTMLHQVKMLTRQMMGIAEDAAPDRFHALRHAQFRSRDSISPIMFASMLCIHRGMCEDSPIPYSFFSNAHEEPNIQKVFDGLKADRPQFFCINNGIDDSVSKGLATLFSSKSPFEL